MIAAPAAMKRRAARGRSGRRPSAPAAGRCVGTANFAMMSTKTKRLSTLSDFSVMYPAKNSPAACPPPKSTARGRRVAASTTQTSVQTPPP